MATKAVALNDELRTKQKRLADFYEAHKSTDASRPYDFTPEEKVKVDEWQTELKGLFDTWREQKGLEDGDKMTREIGTEISRPTGRPTFSTGGDGDRQTSAKSLGDLAIEVLYKSGTADVIKKEELEVKDWSAVEFKTTMTTTAGLSPPVIRSGRMELSLQRPMVIADILPTINLTTGNAYTYMRETVFTNNAAEVAEAGTYPESALQFAEVTENARKIGTFIPVTDEQLADVPGMRDLIDGRLAQMALLRLDSQLLNGNGSAPNINGFYNQVTQTQAKGTDPPFDAIMKGMNLVRTVGMANPTGIIMHPTDFMGIRLMRTTDGIYLMGNPDQVGFDRLFGVPIIQSLAAVAGTALVGDFSTHSALLNRQGVSIQITNSHSDYFVKGIQVIRVDLRAGLVIFRLQAFCEVTGL